MKKITSLLLALVMVFSMSTVAFADDYETLVSYTGDGVSAYEVTVPATLAPGGSGKVKVSGTWATNMTVNVTAPETVTLTNDIDGSTKVLDVEFDGISQAGDNTNSIFVNATISVEQITNALFGTWSGTIVYTVSAEDNGSDSEEDAELITFTVQFYDYFTLTTLSQEAEAGMTWDEWIVSEYNTKGFLKGSDDNVILNYNNQYSVITYNDGSTLAWSDEIIDDYAYDCMNQGLEN